MQNDEAVEKVETSVEVERRVGVACGVAVELLTCAERSKILLVVSPTVRGATILAEGRIDEAEVFARVGACVLRALNDVVPMVNGDAFRAAGHRVAAAATMAKAPAASAAQAAVPAGLRQ